MVILGYAISLYIATITVITTITIAMITTVPQRKTITTPFSSVHRTMVPPP